MAIWSVICLRYNLTFIFVSSPSHSVYSLCVSRTEWFCMLCINTLNNNVSFYCSEPPWFFGGLLVLLLSCQVKLMAPLTEFSRVILGIVKTIVEYFSAHYYCFPTVAVLWVRFRLYTIVWTMVIKIRGDELRKCIL